VLASIVPNLRREFPTFKVLARCIDRGYTLQWGPGSSSEYPDTFGTGLGAETCCLGDHFSIPLLNHFWSRTQEFFFASASGNHPECTRFFESGSYDYFTGFILLLEFFRVRISSLGPVTDVRYLLSLLFQ